jgi:hypothetical protein
MPEGLSRAEQRAWAEQTEWLKSVRDRVEAFGIQAGMVTPREPATGPGGHVGAVSHLLERGVVGHPLQRDGIAGAIARQPQGEGAVVLRHPDAGWT